MNNILFKILMLKGDAGEPTDEQTQSAVNAYMQAHPEAAIDETIINSAVDDWLDDHPEATTSVQDGSLTAAKFTNNLKLATIKDYVTPEMFGAAGDGVTDDTQAFLDACQSGKTVFVNNSVIETCAFSNVKIVCKNLILKGTATIKSVDISGNVQVDGGKFIVDRTTDAGRDDSIFHDLTIVIVNCDTLLTLTGTMFNFRFINNTVVGKCTQNVIKIITSTWITYTIIADSLLGTCDNPIVITDNSSAKNMISDIFITNVYAQKYNASGECRFISTNGRGKLFISHSFMYDISGNDTELYLDRDGATSAFNIIYENTLGSSLVNSVVAKDSNGNYGKALLQDIWDRPFDPSGASIYPNRISISTAFYELATAGYGVATDYMVESENVIGTAYKVGRSLSSKSPDKMIGINVSDNKLTVLYRDVDNQTWTKRTYYDCESGHFVETKAQIDRWGNGHPLFYVPLKKLITRYGSTYYDAMGNDVTSSIT